MNSSLGRAGVVGEVGAAAQDAQKRRNIRECASARMPRTYSINVDPVNDSIQLDIKLRAQFDCSAIHCFELTLYGRRGRVGNVDIWAVRSKMLVSATHVQELT